MESIKTCCIFGYGELEDVENLQQCIFEIFEELIVNKKVSVFYFSNFSEFDKLCHNAITLLKEKHPKILRVYACGSYLEYIEPNERPRWYNKNNFDIAVYFETDDLSFCRQAYYNGINLVEKSDYSIFYVDDVFCEEFCILRYAKEQKCEFINLANYPYDFI